MEFVGGQVVEESEGNVTEEDSFFSEDSEARHSEKHWEVSDILPAVMPLSGSSTCRRPEPCSSALASTPIIMSTPPTRGSSHSPQPRPRHVVRPFPLTRPHEVERSLTDAEYEEIFSAVLGSVSDSKETQETGTGIFHRFL